MATKVAENGSKRGQVMVGDLPDDFLRISSTGSSAEQQIAADQQTAAYLQAQATGAGQGHQPLFPPTATRLSITVSQARLNKNYGLTKMDPYCRIRVGHAVFETHTSSSGGKNPIWNKVIHAPLPAGVDFIYLEIFDERSFTMDDRVAWATVPISERIFNGETVDDWYPLNGKLGDEKEGTKVRQMPAYGQPIVYSTGGGVQQVYSQVPGQPIVVMQGGTQMPMYYGYPPGAGMMPAAPMVAGHPPYPGPPQTQLPPAQPPAPQGPAFTDADVTALKDMFPNIEEEVVRSVLEINRGDKDATINNLLSMDAS